MPQDDQNRLAVPPELRDAIERAADEIFVGRSRERAQLEAALKDAIGGRGRLCLIAGEPGIGKTRLAEWVGASATERGAKAIWGRCWEGEGAPPFWPWVQILRSCMRECEPRVLAARMGIGAPYIAQVVPEVRELLPDLPAAPPLDSEQARFRLYDACATFLRSTAAEAPLVIVLDDLHWADKSSLLLLQFVAREIADSRLFLIGTYRDVEVSRGHPLAETLPSLRRERSVDRVLLRGLSEEDVRAMLALLRGDEVPESFARRISIETAGNPFFIKEILRHLLDEGIAHREGDRWVGRLDTGEIELPESVREVIGRRLERLGPSCTKLLTLASVIGHEFGLDVLQRVSELGEEPTLEGLGEAASARLIDEVPQAIGRYRFSHTLVRETLYGELRTLERVRMHRRVAEVLEELYARSPDAHLSELAHHFIESLPGGDAAKAVDYATRAGDRANEQLAYEEAAIHYERALQALELEEPDERVRCELLLKLGEARWSAGSFEEPLESMREAATLATHLGDPELLARAALGVSGPGVGLHVMALEHDPIMFLKRALAALEGRDSALRAQVMARLAALPTLAGDPQGSAALARAAIAMARRLDDKWALAYVLDATPWAAWGPDNPEERLAVANELIGLAEEVGDARLAAEGHVWKACHYFELGEIAGADRETEIQERFAVTSRHAFHRSVAAANRGARAFLEGRFEEAEKGVDRGPGSAIFARDLIAANRSFITLLREQQGRTAEVLPHIISLAAQYPQVAAWRAAIAAYRITSGQAEEARSDLESLAANDFADVPRDMLWFNVMSRLSEVVSFLGDSRRGTILYDLLLPYADRFAPAGSMPVGRGSISRSLGILAALLSRYDAAERHFEKALEVNARMRARIWVAHTEHDYARMLVARDAPGDREKARALAAKALGTAREVGMKPLVASLLELQAAAGFGEAEGVEPSPEARPTVTTRAAFRPDGDFWSIAYEGRSLRLKDAKGLQYIAQLLRHEGREFHAAELAAGAVGETRREAVGPVVPGLGDAGDVLDAQARSEYRDRLESLRAELDEATHWGDAGRAASLNEEIDFLTEELSAAFGVGGRPRKSADVANRARKAVTSRIRDTIARIAKEHSALALHFENAIRTGVFCSYRPDRSPDWNL